MEPRHGDDYFSNPVFMSAPSSLPGGAISGPASPSPAPCPDRESSLTPGFWPAQYVTLVVDASVHACSCQAPSSSAQKRSPGIGPPHSATQAACASPPLVAHTAEDWRCPEMPLPRNSSSCMTWNEACGMPKGTVSSFKGARTATSAGSCNAASC